ncbi:hypothetical protein NL108_005835 [Boleophthalmus pectinirostris]|nr:hypothetical protein NL108_005835 [Boleophthalmus pectinirostris]
MCSPLSADPVMVLVYSVSLRATFRSSRDPVEMNRVILSTYSGAVKLPAELEVMISVEPNDHPVAISGVCVGASEVVNMTVPLSAAFAESGNTPAPDAKPGDYTHI